jgi:magnesium-transporting ATPase (P-type)
MAADALHERPELPEETPVAWHALETAEVQRKLRSTAEGLAPFEAAERLIEYGPNALPAARPPGLPRIVLHQFLSPLIYVLLVAGVVSLAIGEFTDAGFIFAVIVLNAALGAFQEWKAERSAAALQKLLRILARARRDGVVREIPAEELVPGDVVLLESGQRVPADLRLLQCRNLAVDESLLTGESLAVDKALPTLAAEAPLTERRNLAFAGTTVASGRAAGVVVATGVRTEVGRIAREVTAADVAKPPLLIRMERFARQISLVVLGCVALLALISLAQGLPYLEIFFMAVALAVSAIPEGLPVAMTVALSIAASRMARRNVIVRKLTAVEGLGSCTCIASDKTGTLTVNRQTAKVVGLPGGDLLAVTGEGYQGEGTVTTAQGGAIDAARQKGLMRLARAALLCNEATLEPGEAGWTHSGDAIDVALLALAWKAGLEPAAIFAGVAMVGEIPFESERRYAARFYRDADRSGVALKGALEAVLPFCNRMQLADGDRPLAAELVQRQALALAEGGYRVIAVATGQLSGSAAWEDFEEKAIPPLTFLGLVALIDPLRPEVPAAVNRCRRAGVQVVMVTGDHPATSLTIARELGIARDPEDLVTGPELAAAGSPEVPLFLETVKRATVFSRVTPLQKLEIVEALLRLGHFVAVTGDGVNDAPALRRANIGVAMGSGTDVAKDTAEILVTDDNFASIQGGIEEGRFAYDNIRKVVYLLISTGAAEIVLFTLALAAGLPLPLLAVQLLWLNLVTNGIQDVALAFEGGEPGAMEQPPRPPGQGVFNRLMVEQTLVSGLTMGLLAFGAWWWLDRTHLEAVQARNFLLMLMVLLENVHVFNCRSERVSALRCPLRRNRLLIVGVIVAQGVHILALYTPLMQSVLGVAPVAFGQWLTLLAMAFSLLLVMEAFKAFRSQRP